MPSQVQGGRKLAAFIRKAKAAKSVRGIDVGFFKAARYPDGTPVAAVAGWMEFGTEKNGRIHVPERPYFRLALKGAARPLLDVLVEHVDPLTMALDRKVAGKLGQAMVGLIQTSITTLRNPPLAESTKLAKGSSNPLLDTGVLRKSVTYRIDD